MGYGTKNDSIILTDNYTGQKCNVHKIKWALYSFSINFNCCSHVIVALSLYGTQHKKALVDITMVTQQHEGIEKTKILFS